MGDIVGFLVLVGVVLLILFAAALVTSGMKFRSESRDTGAARHSEEKEAR